MDYNPCIISKIINRSGFPSLASLLETLNPHSYVAVAVFLSIPSFHTNIHSR